MQRMIRSDRISSRSIFFYFFPIRSLTFSPLYLYLLQYLLLLQVQISLSKLFFSLFQSLESILQRYSMNILTLCIYLLKQRFTVHGFWFSFRKCILLQMRKYTNFSRLHFWKVDSCRLGGRIFLLGFTKVETKFLILRRFLNLKKLELRKSWRKNGLVYRYERVDGVAGLPGSTLSICRSCTRENV